MLPLFTEPRIIAMPPSNGKSDLLRSFEQKKFCRKKFTYGLVVAFNKCYFIRLRGTKEGQECASIGHLEIFLMYPVEKQGKSRGTLKEQEMY